MYADIWMINSVFTASIDASAKIVLFAIIYHANKDTHEAFPPWRTLMNETTCRKQYAKLLDESRDAEAFHEELPRSLSAWKESELW